MNPWESLRSPQSTPQGVVRIEEPEPPKRTLVCGVCSGRGSVSFGGSDVSCGACGGTGEVPVE
jgi:hypothetical protein